MQDGYYFNIHIFSLKLCIKDSAIIAPRKKNNEKKGRGKEEEECFLLYSQVLRKNA